MTEKMQELEQNLNEEVQPTETVNNNEEPVAQPYEDNPYEDSPPVEEAVAPQSQKEINFNLLREKARKLEKERDEAIKIARELQGAQKAYEPEEDLELEEDLVEADSSRISKELKSLRREMKGYQQQSSTLAVEAQLKSQFSDFDSTVTKENIEALRLVYPEIAQTINQSPDLYNKAVSAYTLIKRLGIQQEDIYKGDKELARNNSNKPRPLVSVSPQQGNSPISQANAFANGLTDELKKQLHKEMLKASGRG